MLRESWHGSLLQPWEEVIVDERNEPGRDERAARGEYDDGNGCADTAGSAGYDEQQATQFSNESDGAYRDDGTCACDRARSSQRERGE